MAGYKIFYASTVQDFKNGVAEIGIEISGNNNDIVTFSDGTQLMVAGHMGGNAWVIADDDARFLYWVNSSLQSDGVCPTTEGDGYSSATIIVTAEDINDVMVTERISTDTYTEALFNTGCLTQNSNNNPANVLTITNLIGSFASKSTKHIFKNLYINQERFFQFGDVITTSNGDQYIGIGWILHKIGG